MIDGRVYDTDRAEEVARFARQGEMTSAFSQNLRRLRGRRGVRRSVLAELCGLSKNTVARYERGERIPTCESLERLADFFGVTMGELWGQDKK